MTAPDEDALRDSARPDDTRFARVYGARPWHLLVLLALFALTAYTGTRLLGDPALIPIVIWFVGSAVVWDLVVGPAVGLADRGLRAATPAPRRRVSPLNYLRVPALLSGLLAVMFAPLVFRRSEEVYAAKAGLDQDPYLYRWLAITAVLFAVSGLAYLVARRRAAR